VKIIVKDSRDECPDGQERGVYYVTKNKMVAKFTFGNTYSEFANITQAYRAMRQFLAGRRDAPDLTVQLLNNHW